MVGSDKDTSQIIHVSFVSLTNRKKWVFIRDSGMEIGGMEAEFADLAKVCGKRNVKIIFSTLTQDLGQSGEDAYVFVNKSGWEALASSAYRATGRLIPLPLLLHLYRNPKNKQVWNGGWITKTALNCRKISILGGNAENFVDLENLILENNGVVLPEMTHETDTVILYDELISDQDSLLTFLELRANDTLTCVWNIADLQDFVCSGTAIDSPLFKGIPFFVPSNADNETETEQIKLNGGILLTYPSPASIIFSNVHYASSERIIASKSDAIVLKKEWLYACHESGALDIFTEYEEEKLQLPPIGVAEVVKGYTAAVPNLPANMREAIMLKLTELRLNVIDNSKGGVDQEKADVVIRGHFIQAEPKENERTLTCLYDMLEQETLVHECTTVVRHRPRTLMAGCINPQLSGITFIVNVESRSRRSFILDVIETHGASWTAKVTDVSGLRSSQKKAMIKKLHLIWDGVSSVNAVITAASNGATIYDAAQFMSFNGTEQIDLEKSREDGKLMVTKMMAVSGSTKRSHNKSPATAKETPVPQKRAKQTKSSGQSSVSGTARKPPIVEAATKSARTPAPVDGVSTANHVRPIVRSVANIRSVEATLAGYLGRHFIEVCANSLLDISGRKLMPPERGYFTRVSTLPCSLVHDSVAELVKVIFSTEWVNVGQQAAASGDARVNTIYLLRDLCDAMRSLGLDPVITHGHPDPESLQLFCSDGEQMILVSEIFIPCLTSGHNGRCTISTTLMELVESLRYKPLALLRSCYVEICGKKCVCDAPTPPFSIAPRRHSSHDKKDVSVDDAALVISREPSTGEIRYEVPAMKLSAVDSGILEPNQELIHKYLKSYDLFVYERANPPFVYCQECVQSTGSWSTQAPPNAPRWIYRQGPDRVCVDCGETAQYMGITPKITRIARSIPTPHQINSVDLNCKFRHAMSEYMSTMIKDKRITYGISRALETSFRNIVKTLGAVYCSNFTIRIDKRDRFVYTNDETNATYIICKFQGCFRSVIPKMDHCAVCAVNKLCL